MYRVPTEADGTGATLVGQQVQIYWDGDDAYYAGRVLRYFLLKSCIFYCHDRVTRPVAAMMRPMPLTRFSISMG